MDDIEKVMKGLQCCTAGACDCRNCPYFEFIYNCKKHLMQDSAVIINQLRNEQGKA